MVFNATFNNISVISWWLVLLVEETGVPGWWRKPEDPEKTTDLSHVTNRRTRRKLLTCPMSLTNKLYHIMLYTSPWSRFELTTPVVIGSDCISSCKSNYHTITATTRSLIPYIVYYRPECFSFLTPPGDFLSLCMHFVRSDIAAAPGCPPGKIFYR